MKYMTVKEWRDVYQHHVKASDSFACLHIPDQPIKEDDTVCVIESYKKWTIVYHGLEKDEKIKAKLGL